MLAEKILTRLEDDKSIKSALPAEEEIRSNLKQGIIELYNRKHISAKATECLIKLLNLEVA
jgi:hypothetical protein